jgi:hypothetical protein
MRSVVAMLLVACATTAGAQQLPAAADSAIAHALRMASEKDSAGARRALDSLANSGESALVRGEATYQLSILAPSSADRERVLGGLVLDFPFSPRVPTALRELGMLELARNDRDRAALHLTRYLSTSIAPDSGRITAALELGRLLMDRGELPRACAALLVGQSELPEGAIELRNQFLFSVARCQGVDTTAKAAPKPAPDTVPAQRRTGAFTVQVAAYDTKRAADKLATTLKGQGLDARVVGKEKPFRVRVGRYATRAEAEDASRRVDRVAKSQSIVVVVGPEER